MNQGISQRSRECLNSDSIRNRLRISHESGNITAIKKILPFPSTWFNPSNHRNHLKYNAWQGEKTTGKHTGKEHINTGSYLETIF